MSHRQREQRTPVSISARLKSDLGWGDTQICNVSSRGMMMKSTPPPPVGSYVEICRGGISVVGRIKWIAADRFGMHAVEHIDLTELRSARRGPSAMVPDRRRRPRAAAQIWRLPDYQEQSAAAQRLGRMIQFVGIAGAAGLMSVGVSSAVASTLSKPFDAAKSVLSSPTREPT